MGKAAVIYAVQVSDTTGAKQHSYCRFPKNTAQPLVKQLQLAILIRRLAF
jgi:hypothetical protein